MSWIIDWSLYIGVTELQYVNALRQTCSELDLALVLDANVEIPADAIPVRFVASKGGVAALNPKRPGEKGVALTRRISEVTSCTWMWAQAWESSVWYYYLRRGTDMIDAYHVSKEFCRANDWGDALSKPSSPEAHADKLASLCQVESKNIIRYFRDWGYRLTDNDTFDFALRDQKAYPDDRCEYGDGSQLWDLLRRLGFEQPLWNRGFFIDPTR